MFSDLDQFTQGYVGCALWAENDNANESGGEPLDRNYGFEDFAPESVAKIIDDCKRFQEANAVALAKVEYVKNDSTDLAHAGHDFWLTRNGHGAGFWDGDLPEALGKRLTAASKKFGECSIEVGDDGQLHLIGGR